MTLEEVREKLEEVRRRKKQSYCALGILSIGMGVAQGLQGDWPAVIFCIGTGTVLWREGRMP